VEVTLKLPLEMFTFNGVVDVTFTEPVIVVEVTVALIEPEAMVVEVMLTGRGLAIVRVLVVELTTLT
jgi:phage-related protein